MNHSGASPCLVFRTDAINSSQHSLLSKEHEAVRRLSNLVYRESS